LRAIRNLLKPTLAAVSRCFKRDALSVVDRVYVAKIPFSQRINKLNSMVQNRFGVEDLWKFGHKVGLRFGSSSTRSHGWVCSFAPGIIWDWRS
jgi:hypothetical protein